MKIVSADCPNKPDKCNHFFPHAIVIGQEGDEYIVQCEGCKTVFKREAPKVMKKSLRYPHYNDSMGTVVESPDHEAHVAKLGGFEKV